MLCPSCQKMERDRDAEQCRAELEEAALDAEARR
jgi:hypothetical protein